MPRRTATNLDVHPLTPDRFDDLATLFNGRGGSQVRNCWCMYYRRSGRTEVPAGMSYGNHNRIALKSLVDAGTVPGLLGYRDGVPVAWISFGPREEFAKLAKSPVMKRVDEQRVWSIVCFYTAADARGEGLADAMLAHAADYARRQGVRVLEAYPIDKPARDRDDSMWFGAKRMYDRARFVEVARRKPTRPVVRKTLRSKPS